MNKHYFCTPEPLIDPDFDPRGTESGFQLTGPLLDLYRHRGAVRLNQLPGAKDPTRQVSPKKE
jgi:hypothetical protein